MLLHTLEQENLILHELCRYVNTIKAFSSVLLTCCHDPGEDPALAVLDWFARVVELFHDGHTTSPLPGLDARLGVIRPPLSKQQTFVIIAVGLKQIQNTCTEQPFLKLKSSL